MNAIDKWERVLDAILSSRRHALTGAEYASLVDAIDRAEDAQELRSAAVRIATKLGRVDKVAGRETVFQSPTLCRAYISARRPALGEATSVPVPCASHHHEPDLYRPGQKTLPRPKVI